MGTSSIIGSDSDHSSKKAFDNLAIEAVLDADELTLQRMGYSQEFKREFTNFSTISFAFSILGVTSSVASTFNTPMLSAGSASVIWCWLVGIFGTLCMGTCVAEIISAFPSDGGCYAAASYLVPHKYKKVVGFLVGWTFILGQMSVVCSVEFSVAGMILAGVTLAYPDYSPSSGTTVGLFIALLCFHGFVSSFGTKLIAKITSSFIFINLGTLAAICIALLVTCKDKHSAAYIFTDISNQSGYESDSAAFLLGLLSVSWTITDLDAVGHIAEEVKRASFAAPAAIWWSVIGTGVLGWILNIVLVICSGPLEELPGISGYCMAQIIYRNVGLTGFLILWTGVCLTGMTVVATELQAVARNIFAFSRDQALHPVFAKLSKSQVPINATILVVFCASILGLLDLASVVALNAIFALATIALNLGCMVPVVCRLLFMYHPEVQYQPGPFTLGSGWLMYSVSIAAVSWAAFVTVVLALPQVMPVTPINMNYAGAILALVLLGSSLWYSIRGHETYVGPGGRARAAKLQEPLGIISGSLSLSGKEQ